MTAKPTKDIRASVRQRLLNLARAEGEEYQLVLSRYARERFLYRLAQSEHRDRFVLKGAMLFLVWQGELHRVTRDLDLLGYGTAEEDALCEVARGICTVSVPDDGVTFETESVKAERIRGGQEYEGIRVRVTSRLGSAVVPLQVDVGFGDAVTPAARIEMFPTLLDFEAPQVRVYPRETVVAEKFQAMVQLGIANSRMKDYYDLAYLAGAFTFDGDTLRQAIQRTFERRRTLLPVEPPVALSKSFAADAAKQRQWRAFLKKSRLSGSGLETVVGLLLKFLMSPALAAGAGNSFPQWWPEGGGWQPLSEVTPELTPTRTDDAE